MTTITVHLSPDNWRKLYTRATRLGLPVEELARQSLEATLAEPDKPARPDTLAEVPARVLREANIFWETTSLSELAERQGVRAIQSLEEVWGDFWPEDKSLDEFVSAIYQRRRVDAHVEE